MGTDIPSRFLRRQQKTAGFGTKAVVGKAVIRQAFIRQMPASIRAHKLVGLLEDLYRRLKKLETASTSERKRNKGRGRVNNNYTPTPTFAPNVQASGFVHNQPSNYSNVQQNARPFVPPPNVQQNARPFVPPLNPQRNNAAKTIDTANAPVCYFHQIFGDKARTCRSPCAFSLNC